MVWTLFLIKSSLHPVPYNVVLVYEVYRNSPSLRIDCTSPNQFSFSCPACFALDGWCPCPSPLLLNNYNSFSLCAKPFPLSVWSFAVLRISQGRGLLLGCDDGVIVRVKSQVLMRPHRYGRAILT
ncbi:hypothetical protein I3842_09G113800 [Carya illinoinensis]|uniref:Uncharacterized protein n=1 Tax=Carya illinoinensis TaxID=32201 RepID=A0A922E4P0_CARIL|nr:hypothetical protein I3842_09G113800 [Carya illinoinensis]